MVNETQTYKIKDLFNLFAGGDINRNHFSAYRTNTHVFGVYSNSLISHGLYGYTDVPKYPGDSITITGRGSVGHAEYRKLDFDAIIRLLVLIPKENGVLDSRYVTELLNSYVKFPLESTGVPQLTVPQIENIIITLPPMKEQQKIAGALSDVDDMISLLEKLIEKKKAVKQGAMQELLTGKKRIKGFSGEWRKIVLKQLIKEFIVPMRDKPKDLNGPIPWCRIEDFNGKYLYSSKSNQGVTIETINNMNLKVFPKNTLLVSCSAYLGRCAIVKSELVTNQTFIGLVPGDNINVDFLFYVMNGEEKNLNLLSSGTTISYLSREQFEEYKICIPCEVAEQNAIASILSDMDSEIEALEQKLAKTRQIKQGMMQQLLTGKIRLV